MSCDEGTCIHDSLVCDGHAHCPHGEDEADCQHMCSDHMISCKSDCHYRDLCSCSPGYFQCQSGGCVPLQKLCDKTKHCADASDEPPTCVYLRPEQLSGHSLSLDVNNYINTFIQQNMAIARRCLQPSHWSLFNVQNVKYEMHHQRCLPSTLSPVIKFPCGVIKILNSLKRGWAQRISPDIKFMCRSVGIFGSVNWLAHAWEVEEDQEYFSLDRLCIYDHDCDDNYNYHCFNGFHLLKCEHMYCVGRFKCPSSYCISFDHICNKVCDCPHCEDESICIKLLCPGMVLIEQIGSGLRCSQKVATLKYSMNLRQVIYRKDINITDDFPVFIYLEDVMNIRHFILTPEVVVYCEIRHSNVTINDLSMFHRMVSMVRLLLPHNNLQNVYDFMFAFMAHLILLDLSHNRITFLPDITLCSLSNLQYISLRHNL